MSGSSLRPSMPSRPVSNMSQVSLNKALPPTPGPDALNLTTLLIGPKKRRFKVNHTLLCEVSPFFQERLEDPFHSQTVSLWLPSESPAMFGLFVEWVHSPKTFRDYLDNAISSAFKKREQAPLDIHWAIIHLHLFASQLSLGYLQDASMDAIQDLYLKYDWDVSPKLAVYLYTECEAEPAIRLRHWAVAMVAFRLAVGSQLKFPEQGSTRMDPNQFYALFQSLSEFSADYARHMKHMTDAGHDVQLKNPQLRMPENEESNDGRFGFRQCSFHSHRSQVGEGPCPHVGSRAPGRTMSAPDLPRPRWGKHKRQESSNSPRSLFSRNSNREDEERTGGFSHSLSSIASKFHDALTE